MVEEENRRAWLKIVQPFLPTTISRKPFVLVFCTIEISESEISISSVWTPAACLKGCEIRPVSRHGIKRRVLHHQRVLLKASNRYLDHVRTVVSRLQHHSPEPRSLPARPNSCHDT
jgi:hypothetical protein